MQEPINIGITWLEHGRGLPTPAYQTPLSAGMDLSAAVPAEAPLVIRPMERIACPCGFVMALPAGFEAQVRPRSGLAFKNGLSVPNAPGTIDADYRGEVKVLLINLGAEPITITRGMRVAQMVIARHERAAWREFPDLSHLPPSERGAGGFGSTGV
ncbi:MAG TPA: dUTP diphosphatase [Phycisphaerae bacterium]|jgi:dUTP pyrophosphatase|nr:dUTP diphosphatase [Phycisphaerae bacterium]